MKKRICVLYGLLACVCAALHVGVNLQTACPVLASVRASKRPLKSADFCHYAHMWARLCICACICVCISVCLFFFFKVAARNAAPVESR